jgi:hypothetical protein
LAIASQNAKELHKFFIFEFWGAAHLHFAQTHKNKKENKPLNHYKYSASNIN